MLTVVVNKDRTVSFFFNGNYRNTAKTAIPANKFPIDWEVSMYARSYGYLREVTWGDGRRHTADVNANLGAVVRRSSASPCKAGKFADGDFGAMNCGWKRHYSQRQITVADLPVSIAMRCDSNDNIHAGFDSVKGRTAGNKMPYGNFECQNGKVILDWYGNKATHTLYKNAGE